MKGGVCFLFAPRKNNISYYRNIILGGMGIMLRKLKKFILRKQVERCQLKEVKINEKIRNYHKTIIMMIMKGKSEFEIEQIRIKKKRLYDKSYELIDIKYNLQDILRRA
jgi:hypothetical protein